MEMERTIQQMLQQLLANHEKAEANKKAELEQMLASQEKAEANRKADLENLRRRMEEMLTANQNGLKEMIACKEATETEPDPGMMQSVEEHQEIPKGEAAVMPVREPRKRRRVCNLTTGRRQKRKERTRGYRGSRRKSAAACKKVSRHAKVAWRK
jgi:hypothetical protein